MNKKSLLSSILALVAIAFMPALYAGPFSVSWQSGSTQFEREIFPIMDPNSSGGFASVAQYYSYNFPYGASSNTPDNLEESDTALMFLFSDGDELSWVLIMDRFNDGSGGHVYGSITSSGLENKNVYVSVRNDPGDSTFAWDNFTGTVNPTWQWVSCCNDGMALSDLPTGPFGVDSAWDLSFDFDSYSGISQLKVLTLDDHYTNGGSIIDSFSIAPSQWNSLTFHHFDAAPSVPESGSLGLLAFGLMALGLVRGRRTALGTPTI